MAKIALCLIALCFLTGCIHSQHALFAKRLNAICPPQSCLQQALIYADYLDAEVYLNEMHAFVIKNKILYDSTNPSYSGYSILCWQIQKIYGKPETWKKWIP